MSFFLTFGRESSSHFPYPVELNISRSGHVAQRLRLSQQDCSVYLPAGHLILLSGSMLCPLTHHHYLEGGHSRWARGVSHNFINA